MKQIIKNIILFCILFFSFTLIFSINWIYSTYGNISLEEILFQIKVSNAGANIDYYISYAKNALLYIIICTITLTILINLVFKKRKKVYPKRMKGKHETTSTSLVIYKKHKLDKRYLMKLTTAIIILIISIAYSIDKTNLKKYLEYQLTESSLIENEFVDSKQAKIEFPEQKRNLIYIYLESMESTFYSKENDGGCDLSLIEDLEELAEDNIAFSNSDKLKGIYSLPGATWTTGAMTAQTLGIPLKFPIQEESYGKNANFLPGVTGLGEILNEQGYKQMLMIGSNAEFGGRDYLFKQHGNYEIYDFWSAVNEGKRKEEDFIWWGFPDKDLFEYSKEKITRLAEEEQPFNFTMLTADTHATDGYLCEDCLNKFDVQYFNVLDCSSRKVSQFVKWIQEQDFYENTTIVICGDHPSMRPEIFDDLEKNGYERTVLNIIINPAVIPDNAQFKNASTMDMLPTTLASIGASIQGERLGLGTNLFSQEKTLIAKYGLEYVKEELSKKSTFYDKKILNK